ncbi:hypothetical protein J2Z48_002518 [Croceifilum oryzae]|uniref:Uncharacterized protein n=1 Tax=Croceifilum oryzae TaxID=1553429 RepID=A0AAJ1TLW3_9BACL|nr:hypothetical protein [Croceifilum oryzae]MDQ0418326.1 hypothetical protein [Croceifilum oryzae]
MNQTMKQWSQREDLQVLSLVGISKNAGKTTFLNGLGRAWSAESVGLFSIGVDGEAQDVWSGRSKPEVRVHKDWIVATSGVCLQNEADAWEIIEALPIDSVAGRVYLARANRDTSVKLTGVPTRQWASLCIEQLKKVGCAKVIVDGAYNRKAMASPVWSDGFILVVGASFSPSLPALVKEVKGWMAKLLLPSPADDTELYQSFYRREVCALQIDEKWVSFFSHEWIQSQGSHIPAEDLKQATKLYFHGALTKRVLEQLRSSGFTGEITIPDWTYLFDLLVKGSQIQVLFPSNLLAVSINSTSPDGWQVNPEELRTQIQQVVGDIPVWDVYREEWNPDVS